MKLRNLIIYFLFIILFTNQSHGKWVDGNFALIQGLDKITARIKPLKINDGERKSFVILNILIFQKNQTVLNYCSQIGHLIFCN